MAEVRISKEVQFDAGHRVPNHASKCKNPHGHRYRVIVHCVGPIIDDPEHEDDGMLVDFGKLKTMMTELIHDRFDHGFIVGPTDEISNIMFEAAADEGVEFKRIMFPYVPTAENIAKFCYEVMYYNARAEFGDYLRVLQVEVWETPTSQAVYPHV
jgi:6-pyruvoyltetrahydropterin/6-carboxytetrahydropterin synthase